MDANHGFSQDENIFHLSIWIDKPVFTYIQEMTYKILFLQQHEISAEVSPPWELFLSSFLEAQRCCCRTRRVLGAVGSRRAAYHTVHRTFSPFHTVPQGNSYTGSFSQSMHSSSRTKKDFWTFLNVIVLLFSKVLIWSFFLFIYFKVIFNWSHKNIKVAHINVVTWHFHEHILCVMFNCC